MSLIPSSSLLFPYPKTSPRSKGAFSRLLETGGEGPAQGQWWLRWRGAGGAGTHSILNLLAELARPRREPESQIWGMPWRDGWAWGLGGQGEALAQPKTPSCLCSYANAFRRFWRSLGSPSMPELSHTHTFLHALMHSLFFPPSITTSVWLVLFLSPLCLLHLMSIYQSSKSSKWKISFGGPSIWLH